MNKPMNIPDDLLVKVMLGEASEQEKTDINTWLAESSENRKYFEHFQAIWQTSRALAVHSDISEAEAWQRFKRRTSYPARVIPLHGQRSGFRWWSAAAAVFILAGVVWLYYTSADQPVPEQISLKTAGETRTDTLPDGSVVTLNKHSSVAYQKDFTASDKREISLNGEAFFQVKPDRSKPFTIHVNEVTVTVLGTSFNVKSTKQKTEVVVETGLVQVQNATHMAKAKPREVVTVYKAQSTLVKERVKDDFYKYYRTHKLVCSDTPLYELVETLNDIYEVNIIIENPQITRRKINTVFDELPLNQVLSIISETLNVSVEKHDDRIILK